METKLKLKLHNKNETETKTKIKGETWITFKAYHLSAAKQQHDYLKKTQRIN